MEWQWAFALLIGGLLLLFLMGLPIAFCFIVVDIIGLLLVSGQVGVLQFVRSFASSLIDFVLVPLPLFILMGEVLLHSGLAIDIVDAVDKWFGRLPGRLALLAVMMGILFGAVSGMSTATVSMIGRVLMPEMEKRGYNRLMILGSIMGSAGLDVLIPPSALAVLLAAVAQISVGETLLAIIVPGILMAILYAVYIIIKCMIQPSLAPPYMVESTSLRNRILPSVKYLLPIAFIIFMVMGVIFIGVATPSEAAATGALSTFILVAIHKRLNWSLITQSFSSTTRLTIQLLLIVAGATGFSQILTYTGCTEALVNLAIHLPLSSVWIIIAMMIVGLILGMFMTVAAVVMIVVPIFMPIIYALGLDPIWFATLLMINITTGLISPPVGVNLFAMKMVATSETTMDEIYRAAIPYCYLNVLAIALVMAFPQIALWLPGLMK